MFFGNKIELIVVITVLQYVAGDAPNFRVLAPEFVCPNDEEDLIQKPENTVISVKTDAMDLQLQWTVRWTNLDSPSQRFTLLLWRTVRALEAKLNSPQPEPFVYTIDNAELLQGVEYIFIVNGSLPDSENVTIKTFAIDNIKGDQKLLIEGRSEKFSVLLIGGEIVFADMQYVMEAEITTCVPTQNYYFVWRVQSKSASYNMSDTPGSRLEIPPYTMQAGFKHYVSCSVYRNSGEFVTQTSLPFQVLYRGLSVNLNLDALVVTANNEFVVQAFVQNHDYYWDVPRFEWTCVYLKEDCESFESVDTDVLLLKNGLPNTGVYIITVTVSVRDQQASSNMSIDVVEHVLPVIHVMSQPRIVNEHSTITLVANASNVAPACTLTWHFANEEYLMNATIEDSCEDCEHGEALSDSVIVFSLEEGFLNELTDYTNETEWRQVSTEMPALPGRARFVAQCGCSLTFSCDTQGIAYGDVHFELNRSPNVSDIKVSPESGIAMETVFRISTTAASDPDRPLRYSFYCSLGNDMLLLQSYLEHLAVETFLPYVSQSGTDIWVEVCDSLGACSSSEIKTVQLLEGEGRTVSLLVDTMRGNMGRCEMLMLTRIVESTVITYTNSHQEDVLTVFTGALLETLGSNSCSKNNEDYVKLLDWLNQASIDISNINE